MEHTEEEIINALKVIKETCDNSKTCENCPLRENDEDCYIQAHAPGDYTVIDLSDSRPRRLFND